MIGNEFLQARFHEDWVEFGQKTRAVIVRKIPKRDDRKHFRAAFQKLEKAGCHADVLFPCLYILLKSRWPHSFSKVQELKFPWKEEWEQISDGLESAQEKMEKLTNESGIATLMHGDGCWERCLYWGLASDAVSSFKVLHQDLLGEMDQYIVELKDFCRALPPKNIISQYGQAVACIYVRETAKLSFSKTSSLLRDCLYELAPPGAEITRHWARDTKRFQGHYPDFCKSVNSFLTAKHDASEKLPPFNWEQYIKRGSLK